MTRRTVVLGAGYAGLAAATGIARRTRDVEVQLVDANPHFVERVRLHELAAGSGTAERPLSRILAGTGIRARTGRVESLDLPRGEVVLAGGDRIGYDDLVYALGSRTRVDHVPGVAGHAYTLDGPGIGRGARGLAEALRTARTVVVCGGGLTGIEAASEIAESYPGVDVTLATRGTLGPVLTDRGRAHVRTVLGRLGVRVLEGATVAEVTPSTVELADGTTLPSDATVWCGSFAASPIAAAAGLAVDDGGRVLVDETLRSTTHPEVYAAGDGAAVRMPWGTPRMSCQAGLPMGLHVAESLARTVSGRAARTYQYRFMDLCVSLGRRDGLIELLHSDDSPARVLLTGRSAARFKEYVCRAASWAARRGPRVSARSLYPRADVPTSDTTLATLRAARATAR